jgi:hypothetical protein
MIASYFLTKVAGLCMLYRQVMIITVNFQSHLLWVPHVNVLNMWLNNIHGQYLNECANTVYAVETPSYHNPNSRI